MLGRIKLLLTGKTVWVDQETGEETVIYEDWSTSWAIAGIHFHNWRWVRRFGNRKCGCTINPITRRYVLYNMACSIHSIGLRLEED